MQNEQMTESFNRKWDEVQNSTTKVAMALGVSKQWTTLNK